MCDSRAWLDWPSTKPSGEAGLGKRRLRRHWSGFGATDDLAGRSQIHLPGGWVALRIVREIIVMVSDADPQEIES